MVVGKRCQLIAAKTLRRGLAQHAEVHILFAGGTHQIDLAAPYFTGLEFARPDVFLSLPEREIPTTALSLALAALDQYAAGRTGWLVLGSGPEALAALLFARLRGEPFEWWEECTTLYDRYRPLVQVHTGILAGTERDLPKPWLTAARVAAGETLPPREGQKVLIALSGDPLWRLHHQEMAALAGALLQSGHEVLLFSPGNTALLEHMPEGTSAVVPPSLKGLLDEVLGSAVVLSDRLDALGGALALGRPAQYLGVSHGGLHAGSDGAPLSDFMEFGGELITLRAGDPVPYDPLEEAGRHWLKHLGPLLNRLS